MTKQKEPPIKFSQGWLTELDGRTGIAQMMVERYQAFTDDLGGVDRLSYAQRSLVERALWLEYWLADQERQLATSNEFDVGKWVQAANSLQGILSKLGLNRIAKDIPDLATFLQSKGQ
jgi:F0F1-type ATP synthase beta subunit